jgi:hypothetical protein
MAANTENLSLFSIILFWNIYFYLKPTEKILLLFDLYKILCHAYVRTCTVLRLSFQFSWGIITKRVLNHFTSLGDFKYDSSFSVRIGWAYSRVSNPTQWSDNKYHKATIQSPLPPPPRADFFGRCQMSLPVPKNCGLNVILLNLLNFLFVLIIIIS